MLTYKCKINRQNKFRYLKSLGLTYDEIGKIYGISRQRVEQIIKCKYKEPVIAELKHCDKISYLPFEEARQFARSLGIKSTAWKQYIREHNIINIPTNANKHYKDKGWVGWSDFLGSNYGSSISFMPYDEAKNIVHKLNLSSYKAWLEYSRTKRNSTIPSNPDKFYKNKGWISWSDFLGRER